MSPQVEITACVPGRDTRAASSGSARDPVGGFRTKSGNVALWVAIILVCVLSAYWETTLSMVAIWERSETFAHGFIVIPIFCYLLWRKREALDGLAVEPYWPALLGIAACGIVWLFGELVFAASVSQFAMITTVPFAVWALLGTRVTKTLAIPLAFLFFTVPFGEILVPTMMDWTAQFTVAALRASGVPVYQEGNYFVIPSGVWSVVEACSGLRYLIASLMVGCLYAYLAYRSAKRRLLFIAASIAVPIVANWLRAYIIVMIGHLSSNRLAVGVDHLIYGWIFFGLVMAAMFWMGSRWREDGPEPTLGEATSKAPVAEITVSDSSRRRFLATAILALVTIAVWQPLRAHFNSPRDLQAVRVAPLAGRDGWIAGDDLSTWRPDVSGARDELRQTFAKDGQRIGLHIAFYRDQTIDTKAITSTNQLVRTTNVLWRRVAAGTESVDLGGEQSRVKIAVIQGPNERLSMWQWYWVDGYVTSNEYEAKARQALSVLRGHTDAVAWIVIYARSENGDAQVQASLRQFATAMQGPIDQALRSAATQ